MRRSGRTILDGVDWIGAAVSTGRCSARTARARRLLLRIASAAELRPSRGAAYVLGGRLGRVSMPELSRRIGVVEPALGRRFYPVQTALEVVAPGSPARSCPRTTPTSRAPKGCSRQPARRPAARLFATCSEGERARILLARALAADAELLVLDEPPPGSTCRGASCCCAPSTARSREDGADDGHRDPPRRGALAAHDARAAAPRRRASSRRGRCARRSPTRRSAPASGCRYVEEAGGRFFCQSTSLRIAATPTATITARSTGGGSRRPIAGAELRRR